MGAWGLSRTETAVRSQRKARGKSLRQAVGKWPMTAHGNWRVEHREIECMRTRYGKHRVFQRCHNVRGFYIHNIGNT